MPDLTLQPSRYAAGVVWLWVERAREPTSGSVATPNAAASILCCHHAGVVAERARSEVCMRSSALEELGSSGSTSGHVEPPGHGHMQRHNVSFNMCLVRFQSEKNLRTERNSARAQYLTPAVGEDAR